MVILYHKTLFGDTERGGPRYSRPDGSFAGPAVLARGDDPPEPPGGLRPRQPATGSLTHRLAAASRTPAPPARGDNPPEPPGGLRPRQPATGSLTHRLAA